MLKAIDCFTHQKIRENRCQKSVFDSEDLNKQLALRSSRWEDQISNPALFANSDDPPSLFHSPKLSKSCSSFPKRYIRANVFLYNLHASTPMILDAFSSFHLITSVWTHCSEEMHFAKIIALEVRFWFANRTNGICNTLHVDWLFNWFQHDRMYEAAYYYL